MNVTKTVVWFSMVAMILSLLAMRRSYQRFKQIARLSSLPVVYRF
jgi:hypothetical protein